MKKGRETVLRLEKVLKRDKSELPEGFDKVIKSDVMGLLSNYADFDSGDVKVRIDVGEEGNYVIKISASARRLKNVPVIF